MLGQFQFEGMRVSRIRFNEKQLGYTAEDITTTVEMTNRKEEYCNDRETWHAMVPALSAPQGLARVLNGCQLSPDQGRSVQARQGWQTGQPNGLKRRDCGWLRAGH